ncbi:hypothetical protein [Jannaschia donghaensis]|uniref:Uncharacterized protein n=1 Tax=Jannaschia donghaensis TaxID=420998 RepID=A0A0M6YIR8_9RHOB|nr:hypothetical protein [Jannaschia donghaensis]CTQ49669.1 hypothetical protein JDO7802_01684 [Jannaschia donghaensis]
MDDDPKTTPRGTTTPIETAHVANTETSGGNTKLWLALGAILVLLLLFFAFSGGEENMSEPGPVGDPVEGVDAPVAGSIDENAAPVEETAPADGAEEDVPATE